MHHTIVISDIHLCQAEPKSGSWMRYRQPDYAPDREIVAMLTALPAMLEDGDTLVLVLNGDVLDYDAPRVISGESLFHDEPRDDEHSARATRDILHDHPLVVDALARVLLQGHKIVFVSGNHDAQMTLEGSRREVRTALMASAERQASLDDDARRAASSRLSFRAWFYLDDDGVLVEHGGQYDPYCVFFTPMLPFDRGGTAVQPTLGSLASRLMTSRMGFFNPHVDATYERSGASYLTHWFQHYAFSQHSLISAWFGGAITSLVRLLKAQPVRDPQRIDDGFRLARLETGADRKRLEAHAALFAEPVECTSRIRLARELWIDRTVGSALAGIVGVGSLAALPRSWWPLALVAPAALLTYELTTPKPSVLDRWNDVDRSAKRVAEVHQAKAVVFGHTHHPFGEWEDGVFVGNAGSWSASYYDIECTQPVFPNRPLVWLRRGKDGLHGGLMIWNGEHFMPAPEHVVAEPAEDNPIAHARKVAVRLRSGLRYRAV